MFNVNIAYAEHDHVASSIFPSQASVSGSCKSHFHSDRIFQTFALQTVEKNVCDKSVIAVTFFYENTPFTKITKQTMLNVFAMGVITKSGGNLIRLKN